jgi:hypothetical protein
MTEIDNSKEAIMKMRIGRIKTFQKFEDYLVKQLKDPKEAQAFIDAIMEDYHSTKDGEVLETGLMYLSLAGYSKGVNLYKD